MPNLVGDLIIDRVDLVDEGANSAAFIELFKRKETDEQMSVQEIISKMKEEHASVVQAEIDGLNESVNKANDTIAEKDTEINTLNDTVVAKDTEIGNLNDALKKANERLDMFKAADYCTCEGGDDGDGYCKECGKPKMKKKAGTAFDEEETLKGLPESARAMFETMRKQKEAAEETVRKAQEAEKQAEAVAKAATLKSLPIETEKLISIVKNADAELLDCLTAINAAIDGVVLNEVGKAKGADVKDSAWDKIEAEADAVAKRDNITKQKAISVVIKEKPDLYKAYLQEV